MAPGMRVIIVPTSAGKMWDRPSCCCAGSRLPATASPSNPIHHWMWQDFAELRRLTDPILLHVSLPYVEMGQRPHDAINAIQHNSVDGFSLNGGLARYRQLDAIASAIICSRSTARRPISASEAMYCTRQRRRELPGPAHRRPHAARPRSADDAAAPFVLLPDGPGLGWNSARKRSTPTASTISSSCRSSRVVRLQSVPRATRTGTKSGICWSVATSWPISISTGRRMPGTMPATCSSASTRRGNDRTAGDRAFSLAIYRDLWLDGAGLPCWRR